MTRNSNTDINMAPQRLQGNKTLEILKAAQQGQYGVLAAIA